MTASRSAAASEHHAVSLHVGCTEADMKSTAARAMAAGGSTFRLDLSGVDSSDDLVRRFVQAFEIPWDIRSVDAVITTVCDLDWIPGERVFAVAISHFDHVPPPVLDDLATSLVDIADRVRSGGDHCTMLFADSVRTSELLRLIDEQNRLLASLEGTVGDMHPVPVIDHRSPSHR